MPMSLQDFSAIKESPRLFIGSSIINDLKDKLHSPFLQNLSIRLLKDADWLVQSRPISEGEAKTYQAGTRAISSHLQCLTVAWLLTHDKKYRQAAMTHLGNLMNWNHISCEANRETPPDKEMFFCLSYGELSADIGIMFDIFRPDLTNQERVIFLSVIDRFCMKEAVRCLDHPPWWANKEWSNWNGVCAGGMGIMALAFYTDHPDAPRLIPFVEESLGKYFGSYIKDGGGCHEGTGYWNYGMDYSMRYVLSSESATGKNHPALTIKELAKSLYFPLDFTGISFGDNDGWHPKEFFFALAKRLNQSDAILTATTYLTREEPNEQQQQPKERNRLDRVTTGSVLFAADIIPTVDTMERIRKSHTETRVPVARIYDGLDWAALADDTAFPRLRLAARGGSSKITGHDMMDLLSFRCRINGELMITDQQDGGYMPTTFTKRGAELYGRSAASKSTLFVDGLGCRADSRCDTTQIIKKGNDILGIRIDGSHVFLPRWKSMFIGRLFLMVENKYWLVVDRVMGSSSVDEHWIEARFHTLAESQQHNNKEDNWISLQSRNNERMQMIFASLHEAALQQSYGMPSQIQTPRTTIYRWMSCVPSSDHLFVTAMVPGDNKLDLNLTKKGDSYIIQVKGSNGYTRQISLNMTLELE